jgi:hypothetical protein
MHGAGVRPLAGSQPKFDIDPRLFRIVIRQQYQRRPGWHVVQPVWVGQLLLQERED